jgi:hypothetical protein
VYRNKIVCLHVVLQPIDSNATNHQSIGTVRPLPLNLLETKRFLNTI